MNRDPERFSVLRRVNDGLQLENKRLKELLRAAIELPDQMLTADLQREISAILGLDGGQLALSLTRFESSQTTEEATD